jgi:hypothetical protein
MLNFENALWETGVQHIAGVDEAGMAPLAGPICAAAAILPRGYKLVGLDDSKKIIDEDKRDHLALAIKRDAVCWAVGWASVEELDTINIYHAGLQAMRRAVEGLSTTPQHLLVDARKVPGVKIPQRGIIHGDALSLPICAPSSATLNNANTIFTRPTSGAPSAAPAMMGIAIQFVSRLAGLLTWPDSFPNAICTTFSLKTFNLTGYLQWPSITFVFSIGYSLYFSYG